jgi:hypothetical protein
VQLFLCVVVSQHVFVLADEGVVLVLEVLDKMEFVILASEQRDEVTLYFGYVPALALFLLFEGEKGFV